MPENYPPKIRRQVEAAKTANKLCRYGYDAKRGGYFFELLPDPPTCGAKAKSTGAPCCNTVAFEGARCRFHGGASTGPRTAAGRARIGDANRRRKGTRYRVAMPADPIRTGADLIALTPAQRRQWVEAENEKRAKIETISATARRLTFADIAARELERRAQLAKDADDAG